MQERGECHIPVTGKTHSQWGYNRQDLSRTGNHFGEIAKVEKRQVELSWVRGKGQQSVPMVWDRVSLEAACEWPYLC